jgi:hypothetical protein
MDGGCVVLEMEMEMELELELEFGDLRVNDLYAMVRPMKPVIDAITLSDCANRMMREEVIRGSSLDDSVKSVLRTVCTPYY